jgi:hypothetical protein
LQLVIHPQGTVAARGLSRRSENPLLCASWHLRVHLLRRHSAPKNLCCRLDLDPVFEPRCP